MTLFNALGQPALFSILDGADRTAELSPRETRVLVGAMNFHALVAPGRELDVHVYDGPPAAVPRTTDDRTFDGLDPVFRTRRFSLRMQSLVAPEDRARIAAEAPAAALADSPARHILLTRDSALEADPPRYAPRGVLRRVARSVRTRWPLLYDDLRDVELARHRRPLHNAVARVDYPALFEPGGIHHDSQILLAPPAPQDAPRAVLFGLHWFELGGAERWAIETIRIARAAGFVPVVMTNRDSHQPWITRAELDGAVVVPFSEPTVVSQTPGVEEALRAVLHTFDVRGVVVHHNQWLYDRLAWVRASRPQIPIVDSTHIVEYRGGGYPVSSAVVADQLTAHHVISPSLQRFMVEVQRVPAEKVVMAPLGGLTVDTVGADEVTFRPRQQGAPLTVAFVGRMARQKGPEVFVETVARLRKRGGDRMRFIMHGDGDLASWVDAMIAARGLDDVIERRTSASPVQDTLRDAHVLAVSSHNEGLTLTTLEALTHGAAVVSTDVGAQGDIVPARARVPREAHLAVRGLAEVISWLERDERAREELWREERAAEIRLLRATSATEWFAQEVRTW
ncbi:glycosyltransferase [Microbacterium sp. zg.Y909]|uniref:glycosyltransferase n=1 Tax=Microbacterium sp. zg.Y909 TaxID=2969413 RepID=UPI00214CEEB2|nr:glycosyltransferase [Microbacterium sp. zg.Y909]MCR2823992.1 glycosyltransferase [Microbacterium sp. zg.Y909]